MSDNSADFARRQLIVLCDGTNNSIEAQGPGTNVLQLATKLGASGYKQRVFYDPGVGSANSAPGATGMDKLKLQYKQLKGLAFGDGVFDNIAQAYLFLMYEYEPGDEIYIFGFSRGAFTARGLVGMINQYGLLPAEQDHLISTCLYIYFDHNSQVRHKKAGDLSRVAIPMDRRDIPVHFVGVWDTVESIGIPPFDQQFSTSPTLLDAQGRPKCFKHVRQALALDEHRYPFLPRVYEQADVDDNGHGQSLKQLWFPGVHVDVGGMYINKNDAQRRHYEAHDSALSVAAFNWIVMEAMSKGLRLDSETYTSTLKPLPSLPSNGRLIHDELYRNPWWVIVGMALRKPKYGRAVDDAILPGVSALKYPEDTVWSRAPEMNQLREKRSWSRLIGMALAAVLCLLASNWALMDLDRSIFLQSWNTKAFWIYSFSSSLDLSLWSLQALLGDCNPKQYLLNSSFKTALFFDTLMIPAYAFVGARLLSRAFVSIAGLNVYGQPWGWRLRLLNQLGQCLKYLVFADLFENAVSWLYAWSLGDIWPVLTGALGGIITLLSWVKIGGLAMCISLLIWGAWHSIRAFHPSLAALVVAAIPVCLSRLQ